MIDFIQNESKKMMFNCCQKYATDKLMNVESIQLILGINEEGNTYTLCEDYVRKEDYDIMQVLGVRIDFLGYSKLAPPFILKSLVRFSEKYNIDLIKIYVMCVPFKNEKGKNDISLFLYNGNDFVNMKKYGRDKESLEFSDLFSEEDIELPT